MIQKPQQPGIWVPGVGIVPPGVAIAQKAVEEYDPDLLIGQDQRNGDWVVLLDSHGEIPPHPVLRLGPELPGHDEIKRRLHRADTRKSGHKIVDDIIRVQQREKARLDAVTHEGAGEVAEAMDVLLHKEKRHPAPRIFVPGGKDK